MLIFRGADPEQIWHLKAGFVWFQIISGLKINFWKSDLVPVGDVLDVESLAGILRCKVAMLPMTYLGLPLGATFKLKGYMDWCAGKDGEAVGRVEKIVSF